jgi:hypothetical protein
MEELLYLVFLSGTEEITLIMFLLHQLIAQVIKLC